MTESTAAGTSLEELSINTIRTLSMDAVQRANSGHPGTPMALAPLGYLIYTRHLRHHPEAPDWTDRDRFVLSAGHASMLLYSLLHLTGYEVSLEDVKNFRQWGSPTAGHPEYGHAPGVETTTGPLGQGFANGVGMAIAERRLASLYNRPGHEIVDHHVYTICSDGDLMEGVASEAASLAGHLQLGKLIYFWDDNRITIDGSTDLAFTEDVLGRFAAYGWHTLSVEDGNDLDAMDRAIEAAKEDDRPSMIRVRTVIGYGSPNKAGTAEAHGAPLGEEEIDRTKDYLDWDGEPFHVPDEVRTHMREAVERGRKLHDDWLRRWHEYRNEFPDEAKALEDALAGTLPEGWDADLPTFAQDGDPVATRSASAKAINALAGRLPWLVGGSADLAGSNKTMIEGGGDFGADAPDGRNLYFGVREHAMGSLMNGMALHGGVRPFGGTFLIFSDYMRPAVRLAALMKQPVVFVYTHDSVGLGEDGPTHQPIEQLASLRAIPGLLDLRPSDAAETVEAWRFAMEYRDGPVFMALTRQNVPHLSREGGDAAALRRGAYVLAEAEGGDPEVILIGTGSEVAVALDAQKALSGEGIRARVVAMPSWALFERQPASYRNEVLPPTVRARVSVEAAGPMGWHRWVGSDGEVISLTDFGHSAPFERIYEELGLTSENMIRAARDLLGRGTGAKVTGGEEAAGPARLGVDERPA